MPSATRITTLFLDIGGVLLTNGWDRQLRRKAAEKFALDHAELEQRHHLTYDTYEVGKMSLDEYLRRIVFYEKRDFSPDELTKWILEEARPYPEMIRLVKNLGSAYGLKIAVVSNEGRELAEDRIERFRLGEFVSFFIMSCFVHFRKPDEDIYRIALDTAQVKPEQVAYIEDRQMFCEVAGRMGINSVLNNDFENTKKQLADLGLVL
ncbi:hydrolase [Verrucomicrobia bacterium LW23]|nr:hydrolase [Verrucomicrobia bacterium LW23]